MGGLGVLFCIGLYLFIAFKVIGAFKTSRYQWLVIALVVLVPSGDAVVGRWYLQHLCAKEGGLKVYRVVEHVEGFMGNGSHGDEWVEKSGYQFAEDRPMEMDGTTTRYSKKNGHLIKEENVLPRSKYKLSLLNSGDGANFYMRQQYVLEVIDTKEVLATTTQVYFNGGWAENFLATFSDAGGGSVARCDGVGLDYEGLVASTFKH